MSKALAMALALAMAKKLNHTGNIKFTSMVI